MTRFAMLLVLGCAACLDVEADVPVEAIDDEQDEPELEAPETSYTADVGPSWVLYPSTYSSNCTCSFCVAYCVANGTTVKAGTCC